MTRPGCSFTTDHYSHVLSCALESGYRFASFPNAKTAPSEDEYVCALRHDCDNDLVAARRMAALESRLGVTSTYFVMLTSSMYNALAPTHSPVISEIVELGHALGLHFDERAYASHRAEDLDVLIEHEAEELSARFATPVEVVSFHQPSQSVLEGAVKTRLLNTYSPSDTPGLHYVSDSNTVWVAGCPCEMFRQRYHRGVQLLIHPEWWTDEDMTVERKWQRMFSNNFQLVQQSMLRRERAYSHEQEIHFRRRTQG